MSVVSQIIETAQLKVDVLESSQEAQQLVYTLRKRDDQIAELKEELRIMAKRAEENMETIVSMKKAEHRREIALNRKANSNTAESLVTSYVERELKALGACEALAAFRAKRAERRQDVDRVFRCNHDNDDGANLRRATKRRHHFEDEEARDVEHKKQRMEQLDDKWAEDWDNVREKNNEYEDSIIRYKQDIAREEENVRERSAAIANYSLDQRAQAAEKKANRKLWAPFNKELETTEAHKEVEIPKFDDAQKEEDDEDRHYPPNREVDRAEQFGIYIIPPPRIDQEIIQLD